MYSQHSGARRADEAAHRDVCVRHPGLVALEAVFVYSGLGQLANLTGANLLVVPVLSVRHVFFPSLSLSPPPLLSSAPVGRASETSPLTPPLSSPRVHAAYYAERFTPTLQRGRFDAASPQQGYAEEARVKSDRETPETAEPSFRVKAQ